MYRIAILLICLAAFACNEDESAGFNCMTDPNLCPVGTMCIEDETGQNRCEGPSDQDTALAPLPVGDMALANQRDQAPGLSDAQTGPSVDSGLQETDGQAGPSGCGNLRILLKPSASATARVVLVVDRSYSMIEDGDRWTPMLNALQQVTQALQNTVQFGLVVFPTPSPGPGIDPRVAEACAPGQLDVAPNFGTAEQIASILEFSEPRFGQGTPTYSALLSAGQALLNEATDADYILLATDGGPGCNFGLDHNRCVCLNGGSCVVWEMPQNCLDDRRTVDTVTQLRMAQGIRTFVLGLTGDGFLPEARRVLDDMAVAGGTAVNGRHFEVDTVDALARQLISTAGSVVPCRYDLGALADQADEITVTIDGMAYPRDRNRANGWDVDGDVIEFFGNACLALRDGYAHEIQAQCE
ncbi:MAG: vWA domain-containing protein [Myxococcota bacterium]|nr:vWA domain-containing protein [Myxococcota bacterium]